MNIKNDCLVCIYNQALKTARNLQCNDKLTKTIMDDTAKILLKYDLDVTPPFIAKDVYKKISKRVGAKDPLEKIKEKSTIEAKKLEPFIEKKIQNSSDKLLAAIRAAIAGNVIDFGAQREFDLKEAVEEIFEKEFGVCDYEKFNKDLKKAKLILYIADNTGEHIYDKILLRHLVKKYLDKRFIYVTRGTPIINDVTLKEAKKAKIDKICEVVSSGVDTPGLILKRANKKFKELFKKSDMIIAKGMGNYETLYGVTDKNTYFLFKIKCNVVADSLNREVGDIMFLKNKKLKVKNEK
jgi:uncharacterized protein with ATP-grasp and redox domains